MKLIRRKIVKERLLRVENEYFVAGAIWGLYAGRGWICVATAPILSWMKGTTPEAAKVGLLKRGCDYEWL